MTGRQYHDREAERALLGDLMNLPTRLTEIATTVVPGDFYEPGHASVFAAMVELHRDGHACTAEAVRQHLGPDLKLVGGAAGLAEITQAAHGATRKSAATIREWAAHRRIRHAVTEVAGMLDDGFDPAVILDRAGALLASIDPPTNTTPTGLLSFDQLLDQPTGLAAPWVIPGLFREGWRAMIVATEGVGKSVLARQISILAAQGVHPLTLAPMPPVTTLLVDLENPQDAIAETAQPIRTAIRTQRGAAYRDDAAWIWMRPAGIDLRSRRDRLDLEAVIAEVRPKLVCLGPMYKAYRVTAKESDEQAVGEVQAVFDDLRTRYGFALLLEHHAPKGPTGATRDLSPYGSSFWLRWPEFGIKLTPVLSDPSKLAVQRWRGDRLTATWPDELQRGAGRFPWTGVYPNGTF